MSMIFNDNTIKFLDSMAKVYSISFSTLEYNDKTKKTEAHPFLFLDRFSGVYVINSHATLYSRDTEFIERLHGMCRFFNYDTRLEKYDNYALLMFVASDGPCPYMRRETHISISINGKLASHLADPS